MAGWREGRGEFLVFSFEFLVPVLDVLALLTPLVVLIQRLTVLKVFSKIVGCLSRG